MKRVTGPSGKNYYVKHRDNFADGTYVIEVYSRWLRRNIYTFYTQSHNGWHLVEFYKKAVAECDYKGLQRKIIEEWDGDCR